MKRRHSLLLALSLGLTLPLALPARAAESADYFPPRHDWQRRTPQQLGVDEVKLAEALRFIAGQDNPAPRDQALALAQSFGAKEPHFGGLIGPTKPRAAINGLVVHRGYVLAEWGDTHSVDMTHSVAKTFLSTVVGLAWQQGLIRDVHDRAGAYMPAGVDLFSAPHNQAITWDHLLRQTSDWQGTLWGKPDWADRPEGRPDEWANRKLYEPGTRYKYNDVRINALALAALQVWRRPLPEVLRERVMDPIGASSRWRWVGYDNSWVELDGQRMQSVSGGGHWGGGMFIDAWDLARFGYLFLRDGRWAGQQIVSPDWIRQARTPGTANPGYGYANWFLNTGRKLYPAAPESAVAFLGNGQNVVYIDRDNDLVVVLRWIDNGPALNEFLGRLLAALKR
ncbi:serine hydrolase domain-containing protein [Roseateles violae]|uniref:Serine hydrolase n=1 Tax=Roseateles violae TaxID=3058042 RepID=A0ABT8DUL6_9BURK|nr:serine hydrolase [Pelomonas sp. PFR6]MDN3919861.1 serine hydrolase [Pelomonas sp. PFR6]